MNIESRELMRRIRKYFDDTNDTKEREAYLKIMGDIVDIEEIILMDMEKGYLRHKKEIENTEG